MKKEEIQLQLKKHTHFTRQLHSLIESLLFANNINFHIIDSRTKDIDSLIGKLDRKKINNLADITDLSGIRIIVYYQDVIDLVEQILNDNFKIDSDNSVDKSQLYKSNEFGYLSAHYIISLNKERENLTEWKSYKDLKAEIQVRTVLQHSWASISHELSYKKEYEIPKKLERQLFRLAGLFELADEQFLNIREAHTDLLQQLNSRESSEIENEKIDLMIISYLFENKGNYPIFDFIKTTAEEGGFMQNDIRNDTSSLPEIIQVCKILRIENVGDFIKILEENKELYPTFFEELISKDKSHGGWYGDIEFYVLLALMLNLNDTQLNYFKNKNDWSSTLFRITTNSIKKIKPS